MVAGDSAGGDSIHNGGCLCGAVRFVCGPPLSNPVFCHCQSCRRAAGAHVVAWMTVDRHSLRYSGAQPQQYRSSPQVLRGFCERCGTPLTYWHDSYGDKIDVTLCSLDEPGRVTPTDHIWMSDAVAWDRPTDGLAQHAALRK